MDKIAKVFSKPPKLYTKRLILRAMDHHDYRDMYEYASDPNVTRYLLWAPHDSPEYTKRYLKQIESSYKKGQFFDWGVELAEERKFIGTCGLAAIDMPNNCGELGYVFNPAYWGMGIATEALSRVIHFCFDELGFNRLESRYMIGNDASRRVMEKCGMKFEGIKRGGIFVRDGYVDIGICSILKSDPRPELSPAPERGSKINNIFTKFIHA